MPRTAPKSAGTRSPEGHRRGSHQAAGSAGTFVAIDFETADHGRDSSKPPDLPYVCTVRLARDMWGLVPTTLPDVCRYLGIPLRHHDAESDAEACARIVLHARKAGATV